MSLVAASLTPSDLLGRLFSLEPSSPEVYTLATHLVETARQQGHTLALATGLYRLGIYQQSQKHFEEARRYLEEALAIGVLNDEDTLDCRAALMNCVFKLGLYDHTLTLAQQVIVQSRGLHNKELEAEAQIRLGSSYFHLGMLQESLAASLARLELLNHQDGPALNGIACVYWKLKDVEKALHYYQLSLDIARQTNNRVDEGIALCNLANCYGDIGERDKALLHTFEADRVFRDSHSHRHIALNLGNLGNFYIEEALYDKAYVSFAEALEILKKSPERGIEGWLHMRFGYGYIQQKRYHEALHRLQTALVIMEEAKALEDLYEVHLLLSETYEQLGDFGKALEHYKAFHSYKEQVFNESMGQQTKLLMTQFEVERVKQEQALAQLKNAELAQVVQQLEELSQRDGLTGLFNRRYLDQRLEHFFEDAKLVGQSLSVLISDIDNFKKINDQCSHAVGDEVLKIVAAIYKDNVWGADIVARYGGEEFVVVFTNTPLEQAQHVAEKLRQKIEHYPWHEIRPDLRVTVSMGLSADLTVSSYEKLLSLADAKLYEAKRSGKNQVRS